MHPFVAVVALYPSFFGESIVLVLLKRRLAHFASVIKGHGLGILQQSVARSAPVVLLRGIRVIEGIATNALHTACAITIEHRRLKETSLGTTQGTRVALALLDLLLGLDGLLEYGIFALKALEHIVGHFADVALLTIVKNGVVEDQANILFEVIHILVDATVELLLNESKVHGLLHDVEVIRQTKFDGVNGVTEHPPARVVDKLADDGQAPLSHATRGEAKAALEGVEMLNDGIPRHRRYE